MATVSVDAADLGRYDTARRSWVVDSGRYTLFAQECAGSRWDGYLVDVKPIPNPPLAASGNNARKKPTSQSKTTNAPTWQGASCAVMGSVDVLVQ